MWFANTNDSKLLPMRLLKVKVLLVFWLLGIFSEVHQHVYLDGCRPFKAYLHKVVRFVHATWLAFHSFVLRMLMVLGVLMLLLYNSSGKVIVVGQNEETQP